jgi:hypothetical protein
MRPRGAVAPGHPEPGRDAEPALPCLNSADEPADAVEVVREFREETRLCDGGKLREPGRPDSSSVREDGLAKVVLFPVPQTVLAGGM